MAAQAVVAAVAMAQADLVRQAAVAVLAEALEDVAVQQVVVVVVPQVCF